MTRPTCETCDCYVPKVDLRVDVPKHGTCHIMPPTMIMTPQGVAPAFPIVMPENWCAQHRPGSPIVQP